MYAAVCNTVSICASNRKDINLNIYFAIRRLFKYTNQIHTVCSIYIYIYIYIYQWRTDGGFEGGSTPPPEITKTLQNRAKLNPIVKTVKNC